MKIIQWRVLARIIICQNYSQEIYDFTECLVHYECSDLCVGWLRVSSNIMLILDRMNWGWGSAEYIKELQNLESSTTSNTSFKTIFDY